MDEEMLSGGYAIIAIIRLLVEGSWGEGVAQFF